MIDDSASDDVSSDEEEAVESSMPERAETDDPWDAVIDYTNGKMSDKLRKKKSKLMRQDSELTKEDAVQTAHEGEVGIP